jgi:hypothetical protein
VTRHLEPGAHRNLIGLKVTDDMLWAVTAARGDVPVQDFLRSLISNALAAVPPAGWTDWERRAHDAERKLELARAALE